MHTVLSSPTEITSVKKVNKTKLMESTHCKGSCHSSCYSLVHQSGAIKDKADSRLHYLYMY